jgi:hypothetical protein
MIAHRFDEELDHNAAAVIENDITSLDFGKIFEQIIIKSNLVLIITKERLELYNLQSARESYKRCLVWYQIHKTAITPDSIQGFEVQHQSPTHSRLLLVINSIMHIYLVSTVHSRFRSCTLIAMRELASANKGEQVYDAKFFKDMDVAYTKRSISNEENQNEMVESHLRKVNQFVFLQRTQNLPLNWYKLKERREDRPHWTKNCSSEPMKINYCANYLHMILSTSSNLQVLFDSIYCGEAAKREVENQIMSRPVVRNLKDFKILEKLEEEKEFIDDQTTDLKKGEEVARKLDWRDRYEDGLLFENKIQKLKSRMISSYEYGNGFRICNELNGGEEGLVKPKREEIVNEQQRSSATNVVTELVSSNMHNKDRLIFIAEKGVNPGLMIVGGYKTGLKFIENYPFHTLFKTFCPKEGRTFNNLTVVLDKVYETQVLNHKVHTDNPNSQPTEGPTQDYQESQTQNRPDRGVKKSSKYYDMVHVFDYNIMFMCPEEDALIIMRLRVMQEDVYFSRNKKGGLIDSKKVDENAAKGKSAIIYYHKIMQCNYEVIKDFSKEINEISIPVRQPVPTRLLKRTIFPVEDRPRPLTMPLTVKFDPFPQPVNLPSLPPFAIEFYYVDANWYTKYVQLREGKQGRGVRVAFSSRAEDLPTMEEMIEIYARQKLSERLKESREKRGRGDNKPRNKRQQREEEKTTYESNRSDTRGAKYNTDKYYEHGRDYNDGYNRKDDYRAGREGADRRDNHYRHYDQDKDYQYYEDHRGGNSYPTRGRRGFEKDKHSRRGRGGDHYYNHQEDYYREGYNDDNYRRDDGRFDRGYNRPGRDNYKNYEKRHGEYRDYDQEDKYYDDYRENEDRHYEEESDKFDDRGHHNKKVYREDAKIDQRNNDLHYDEFYQENEEPQTNKINDISFVNANFKVKADPNGKNLMLDQLLELEEQVEYDTLAPAIPVETDSLKSSFQPKGKPQANSQPKPTTENTLNQQQPSPSPFLDESIFARTPILAENPQETVSALNDTLSFMKIAETAVPLILPQPANQGGFRRDRKPREDVSDDENCKGRFRRGNDSGGTRGSWRGKG